MHNKIKICYVIDSLVIGGTNILTYQIINHLVSFDLKVKLIVLFTAPDKLQIAKDKLKNIEYIQLNFENFKFIRRIFTLKKHLIGCDLIHSCMEMSNFYCSIINFISFNKQKFISTAHGIDGVYIDDLKLQSLIRKEWSFVNKFKMTSLQNYLYKFYNGFIAVCEDTKKYLVEKRNIKKNKIITIYHGSDLKVLGNVISIDFVNSFKKKYFIKQNDFVIGYVGRVTYAKGLEELINVIQEIVFIIPCLKLLLIGGGEIENEILLKVKENKLQNNVIITGMVNDTSPFYKLLDLFILTSYSESTSLATQEAMYNNIICLCSDAGGLKEVIEDSVDGFLFTKGNFEEFKDKLIYIYNKKDSLNYIRENARKKIVDKFDLSKNIYKIIEEFNEIIKDN